MDTILTKSDIRSITVTTGVTFGADVVVYKMATDYSWEEKATFSIAVDSYSVYSYTEDGVYKFTITENLVDTDISDINYQDFMDYFANPIATIIECSCADDCEDKDLYDFCSSVFLGLTYFGNEYFNLYDITSIADEDLERLKNTSDAIYRTVRYINNAA